MNGTDWVVEGAQVAEVSGGYGSVERATRTTISRLTATQVVLANGRRYNRRTLRLVGESRDYGYTELLPVDHLRVRRALAASVVEALYRHVTLALKDKPADVAAASAALDLVERRLARARTELDGLS